MKGWIVQESQPDVPPGATPIDTDELLAAIGELYVQVRVLRRMVVRQEAAERSNHAVQPQQ
jgi:hypothetical protein